MYLGSPTYANLTFEKVIMLPGSGVAWSDTGAENYAVEFDLDTGVERALCLSRRSNSNLTGMVSRIPWIE